jgi:hypothetical protein
LHERDEQLEVSQAQAAELHDAVEHLQELIPQEPEEPEEDPKEVEGSSSVKDNYIVRVVRLLKILGVPCSLSSVSLLAHSTSS